MRKNDLKHNLILLILFLMLFSITACGKKKDEVKSIRVGIIMYDEYDPFTSTIATCIKEELERLGNNADVLVNCDTVFSNKSQMRQNDQVRDFIDKNYDVMCINIVDRTDAMQIIDMAKNANVPVVFFNRELVKEDLERWDKLYYVGADPEQSARMQGDIINDIIKDPVRFAKIDFNHDGQVQYVMLEGEAGHQDAIIRTKVSVEQIKKSGKGMEKLGDEIANWNREQAKTKMTSILNGYPWQIELVIANDDNIALGALDALETFGVPELPMIVGVNGELEVFERIIDGKISGTVYNNAFKKGEIIGNMAFSLGTEGIIPSNINPIDNKYIYVPYEKVDITNVDAYFEKAVY